MRKIIGLIGIIVIMFSVSQTALAGSIPEDLLHEDFAQIFFVEVVYYHPAKENPDIELSPVKVVKGDVETGGKLTYYKPNTVGDFRVREGNVYLFTYFDENNPTDIFVVTSYDTSTLKLKNVEGDMWMRFQKYINDGSYDKAEHARREKLGLSEAVTKEVKNLPSLKNNSLIYRIMPRINCNILYVFVFPALVGLLLGICLWRVKKAYIVSGLMIVVGAIWWCVLSQINTHGSEGPGILAIMYTVVTVAFAFVEIAKVIARKINK